MFNASVLSSLLQVNTLIQRKLKVVLRLQSPAWMAVGLALLLSSVGAAGQYVPIMSVDPATQYTFNERHDNGMVGWMFNLLQPITVSQVGWYDDGQDGLSRSYQIGLWQDSTGTPDSLQYCVFHPSSPDSIIGDPINGITIAGGTSASLNGAYRIIDLPSPITLAPGNYEIGGLDTASTTDTIRYLANVYQSPCAGLTQGAFFYSYLNQTTTTLQATDNLYALYGLELGPMLFTTVPEPNSLALLAWGLLWLVLGRRR